MKYPDPLSPEINISELDPEQYSRAGNSYIFTEEKMIILKSGNRYSIDFSEIGGETVIETDTGRNSDLDEYVIDSEYYRLLREGISLSHFSTFSDGENAYVLTGPPNTGKTGVNLALNKRSYNFMADEDAPITGSGKALPLQMPLAVGNKNIEEFQELLDELDVDYSKIKTKVFRQVRKLPIPLIGKALDRLVDPVTVDPSELNFEEEKKDIETAFYIQPEKRDDIRSEDMEKEEFVHKMVLWNEMQRSGFKEKYRIWRTGFEHSNSYIENSKEKDKEILNKCFEDVKIRKLRVPLERQPMKIADFIEDRI